MGISAGSALKLNFLDDPDHLRVWSAARGSQRNAITDFELIKCGHIICQNVPGIAPGASSNTLTNPPTRRTDKSSAESAPMALLAANVIGRIQSQRQQYPYGYTG